jgi:hypothetical protein
MGGHYAPAALPPQKGPSTITENFVRPGFKPRTVQPVASRYTSAPTGQISMKSDNEDFCENLSRKSKFC